MPFLTAKTISQLFLSRIAATPDHIGYKYKTSGQWRDITYRKFHEDVRATSFGLMGLGIEPGDRIAILSQTRYEWSVFDLAILGAGAVTVPVYSSSTAQDVRFILEHSEAKVVIVEDLVQLQKLTSLPTLRQIVLMEGRAESTQSISSLRELGSAQEARSPTRFEQNLRDARPSDPIAVVYTSGTTGIPKGAVITHDNLMSVLEDCLAIISSFSEPESETILSYLPFSHILGKVESVAGLTFGWTQAFAESMDRLLDNLTEIRPTLLFSVPRIFEKAYDRIQFEIAHASAPKRQLFDWALESGKKYYAKLSNKQLPSPRELAEYLLARNLVFRKVTQGFGGRLKFAICGGAPLSQSLGEFFQIAGIKVLEGYGLTETCGPVSVNTPDQLRFGTVGKPLAEVSVRTGEDGEIQIHSRKVFSGYLKSPDETASVMEDGWFKTGDIGYIDDDGFIHITGRKKDLIITAAGKNIAPQKIESLAQSSPWIHQMVVIGDRRPYLVALLTLNRERVIQAASEKGILFSEYAELIRNPKIISMTHSAVERINAALAKHETIKKFMVLPHEFTVAAGELTPSLKVKRQVVESRYEAEINSLYESPSQARPNP